MKTRPRPTDEHPQLFGYTVFGKVVSGMDVEKIKSTPTGAGGPFPTDVPKTPNSYQLRHPGEINHEQPQVELHIANSASSRWNWTGQGAQCRWPTS
jgi:hypothetical protein